MRISGEFLENIFENSLCHVPPTQHTHKTFAYDYCMRRAGGFGDTRMRYTHTASPCEPHLRTSLADLDNSTAMVAYDPPTLLLQNSDHCRIHAYELPAQALDFDQTFSPDPRSCAICVLCYPLLFIVHDNRILSNSCKFP